MDKKKQMNFNLNNFLLAIRDILDTKEINEKNLTKSHSLRVAFISLKIAQELNYEPKEMFDLCAYSLFHNYIDEEKLILLDINNAQDKLSYIVNIVHNLEEKYDFGKVSIEDRTKVLQSIQEIKVEQNLDNKMQDIFLKIQEPMSFWLDCQDSQAMLQFIYSSLYDFTKVLSFGEILKITSMFGGLYENVENFIKKCEIACDYYEFEHKDKLSFLIAASLLNFGKLSIDEMILNKKGKLSFTEFEIIKTNVYYNKNVLKAVYGFDDIAKLSSRHQEQIDGNGYPEKLSGRHLSFKDRLMAILHIYDALLQNRPYRDAFSHEEAISIMKHKVKFNHIDKALVDDIKIFFKKE